MPGRPIRFGTSGWRGVIGDEVTLPRATAVVRAAGQLVRDEGWPPRVLVAGDSRAGSARLAREATATLSALGLSVGHAEGVTPTPAAAFGITRHGYGAGLVFTASHNPPADHGLKVLGPRGSTLSSEQTRRLERLAARALREAPEAARRGRVRSVAPVPEYLDALRARLDGAAIQRANPAVTYDAMHGAGAGVLDPLLESVGARVGTLRAAPDVRFGGTGPDPIPARLEALRRAVRKGRGLRLGLATDGDGDRYAVVDADGRVLSATQAVALLVDHLAQTGRITRGVAISVATGSLVEHVARAHGLAVLRRPIGFKWLSHSLLAGEVDCAGEESGGFVWREHGVDKDGILAGALLTELLATGGIPLGDRLAALEARHGESHCGRKAIAAGAEAFAKLEGLGRRPPARVDGARVTAIDRREGVRLAFDDGFMMLRASGTEPVIRIYAEARSETALAARLARGARWLAARSSGNLAD